MPAAVTFYAGSGTPIVINSGEIKTIAGTSNDPSSIGDGMFATSAKLLGTTDLAVNPTTGDIYLAEPFILLISTHKKFARSMAAPELLPQLQFCFNAKNIQGLTIDNSGRLVLCSYTSDQIVRESGAGTGSFAVLPVTAGSQLRDHAGSR